MPCWGWGSGLFIAWVLGVRQITQEKHRDFPKGLWLCCTQIIFCKGYCQMHFGWEHHEHGLTADAKCLAGLHKKWFDKNGYSKSHAFSCRSHWFDLGKEVFKLLSIVQFTVCLCFSSCKTAARECQSDRPAWLSVILPGTRESFWHRSTPSVDARWKR